MKRLDKLAEEAGKKSIEDTMRVDYDLEFSYGVAEGYKVGYHQALQDAANAVAHLPVIGFHAAKRIRALADQEDVCQWCKGKGYVRFSIGAKPCIHCT